MSEPNSPCPLQRPLSAERRAYRGARGLLMLSGLLFFGACGGGSEAQVGEGDAGRDVVAPSFLGVQSAEVVGETRVDLKWSAAEDDVSGEERLVYRVYVAEGEAAFNFRAPWLVTPSGALGASIDGLEPLREYRFIVRAVDEGGNEDNNQVELSSATPDQSPPKFAGVSEVSPLGARALQVTWRPAFDKGTPEKSLIYRIYLGIGIGSINFNDPIAETQPGRASYRIEGLEPLTDYAVAVRAVDLSGNEDTNVLARFAKTPEGEPPNFRGIKQAIATGQSIKLYWQPATDNITQPASIVYDIFQSTEDRGHNLEAPTYTTLPGQSSYIVRDLAPNTKYYYVVRARDFAGNRDTNNAQANATTSGETDTTPPSFGGVGSISADTPSSLRVAWSAGSDAVTPTRRLVYHVFLSETPGAHDFSAPSWVTAEGVSSALITGLAPSSTRYVVVRAQDEAGNISANTQEIMGTTLAAPSPLDELAPTFSDETIQVTPSYERGTLAVSWTAAADDSDVRYHICAETNRARCEGDEFWKHVRYTTGFGAVSAELLGLRSNTEYFVFVRAEDESGNLEHGERFEAAITHVSYSQDILPLWRDQCNGCHNFDSARTRNVPSGFVDPRTGLGVPLVQPLAPENSLIYRRINSLGETSAPFSVAIPNEYSGMREPRNGDGVTFSTLASAEIQLLHDWITQGAFAN